MKKFRVPVIVTDVIHIEIEAEDKAGAHAKVDAMQSDKIIEDGDHQAREVDTLYDETEEVA